MSIVKEADKEGRKFLSFINVNNTTPSLNDFHKFILSALLQGMNTYIFFIFFIFIIIF